ncbi:MAG TPA: chemotaxis protein CheB [Terriglobales bacterium]|nr:chemotaxis protein CheB [Terriglobales bacterium]
MSGYDIVVMGGSAGGIPPLQRVLSHLPAGFPASVLVAIHTAAEGPRLLPDILRRTSSLPVRYAEDGDSLDRSRVLLAPPDRHLLLDHGGIRVTSGPRENRHRPAIDPLFRSAARTYGPRVIAVLLSGLLDDGTAGLKAVTRQGGVSVVQDPEEARFGSMPQNAVTKDSPQYILPVEKIGPILIDLVMNGSNRKNGEEEVDDKLKNEVKIAEIEMSAIERDKPGRPSAYACPECNGILWEIREGELVRFRCRVGHAYGAESLVAAKDDELEGALWTALRTLEEKMALHRRLCQDAERRENPKVANHFRQSAEDMQQQAKAIRSLLLEREPAPGTEDPKTDPSMTAPL